MADCVVCSRPIHDTAYVDQDCTGKLGQQLRAAAALIPELDVALARQTRFGEPGPRPRNSAPAESVRLGLVAPPANDHALGPATGLPFSEAASIARGSIVMEVETWCRVVLEERYPGPAPIGPRCNECDHTTCERIWAWQRWMPPPAGLANVMVWLAGQLDWARYRRWAGEAWDGLGSVARLVERAVDRPIERVDAGLCLAVDEDGEKCQRRLSAPPGAVRITCPDCGAQHDPQARRELLLAQARAMRGTATELARWLTLLGLPTPADTVYKWVKRGRLLHDGSWLYAFRDAETLRLRSGRSAA